MGPRDDISMPARVSALVRRRPALGLVLFLAAVLLLTYQCAGGTAGAPAAAAPPDPAGRFSWASRAPHYPVERHAMRAPPGPIPQLIGPLQHRFAAEGAAARRTRLGRLQQVRANFTHAWAGYKKHAWMSDELRPLSGGAHNPFGGWAATLVDTLDTLWIMGLRADFDEAVRAVEQIDFTTSSLEEINVFETTIRYLGGFLGAHDLSGGRHPSLLRKAVELGDMLYAAFDTPNRLPVTRWRPGAARDPGARQAAPAAALLAEVGSLTLEFTRLSQLSGDPKYYDAVQRVTDVFAAQQDDTKIPGLWPMVVNAETADFTGYGFFTIGGMADSMYEYLPKEYILLGGGSQQYRDLYVKALAAMKKAIFFRPRTPQAGAGAGALFPGNAAADGKQAAAALDTEPRAQHLGCFAGGMVGLAARALGLPDEDMATARRLLEGCLWAYETAPAGIMPESMFTAKCPSDPAPCPWDEAAWHEAVALRHRGEDGGPAPDPRAAIAQHRLAPGVAMVEDARYLLRPEAVESAWVLYRLTGEAALPERAWAMFEAVVAATQTDLAHAALDDCTAERPRATRADRMESFWLAETLKYFYLMFETPDVVSLDEYVLNTEAHPLRWRRPGAAVMGGTGY